MEKKSELKRGELPNGNLIGYYRNPEYAALKREMNPLAGGRVDLFYTGSFYRQMFVNDVGVNKYLFDSYDDKTNDLVGKYGLDILGISPEAWQDFQSNTLRSAIVTFIKSRL